MQEAGRLSRLIVLEGIDGAGTTTQARLLTDRIRASGHRVWSTSEPTSSDIGRLLRSVLAGTTPASPVTEAYLFAADRWEHVFGRDGIVEHHEAGEIVVCDRYKYSSLVYQTIRSDPRIVRQLNARFPDPGCVVFVDLDTAVGAERLARRVNRDIYEGIEYQDIARTNYLSTMEEAARTTPLITVSGSDPESEVHRKIWEALERTSILTV